MRGVLVCVCVSAPEIPPKIPNEPHREEWQPAQAAVDQSAPTHCKSPTPQVGTGGRGRPAGATSPRKTLLFFGGHQQSRAGMKAPQREMGTPLIKPHRWSTLVADYA